MASGGEAMKRQIVSPLQAHKGGKFVLHHWQGVQQRLRRQGLNPQQEKELVEATLSKCSATFLIATSLLCKTG
jgi:hypothetical protein